MAKRKRRSKTLDRIPTTREGRQPKSKPTPERLAHFKYLVGREWTGHSDIRSSSPLNIMEARGLLNGNTLAMVSAGEQFRELYIRRNGPITAKTSSIGQMTGAGSIGLPFQERDDIEREQRYQKINLNLLRKGRAVHAAVIDVAVCQSIPVWLQRIIDGDKPNTSCREREDLMAGLEILIN